jgi:hypothetical protein
MVEFYSGHYRRWATALRELARSAQEVSKIHRGLPSSDGDTSGFSSYGHFTKKSQAFAFLQRTGCQALASDEAPLNSVMIATLVCNWSFRHQAGFTAAPQGGLIMSSKQMVLITGFGRLFTRYPGS